MREGKCECVKESVQDEVFLGLSVRSGKGWSDSLQKER